MAREEAQYEIVLKDQQTAAALGSGIAAAMGTVMGGAFEGASTQERGRRDSIRGFAQEGVMTGLGMLNPFRSESQVQRQLAEIGGGAIGAGALAAVNMEEFGEAVGRALVRAGFAKAEFIESKARGEVGGIGSQLARAGVPLEDIKAIMSELMPRAAAAAQREANAMEAMNEIEDPGFKKLDPNTAKLAGIGKKFGEVVSSGDAAAGQELQNGGK